MQIKKPIVLDTYRLNDIYVTLPYPREFYSQLNPIFTQVGQEGMESLMKQHAEEEYKRRGNREDKESFCPNADVRDAENKTT